MLCINEDVLLISTGMPRPILYVHSMERWTKFICRTFIILLFLPGLSYSAPATTERPEDIPTSKAVNFLMRFGYLPQSGIETGNLQTEDQIKEGIKRMQEFGGLRPTGLLNKETIELMNRSRCGLPDMVSSGDRFKRFILQGDKWDKYYITYVLDNWSPDLGHDNVRREIYNAFKVWSDVSSLTFSETGSPDADIHIQFATHYHGDGYPFDGPGMVLAHAFFPGPDRGGDCHFDEDELWTQYESKGVNLFSVAAHEFGHSLGLSHSPEQGALMFPYYQGYKKNFQLHYDDILGITTLYGSRPYHPGYPGYDPYGGRGGTGDGGVDDPYGGGGVDDPYGGGGVDNPYGGGGVDDPYGGGGVDDPYAGGGDPYNPPYQPPEEPQPPVIPEKPTTTSPPKEKPPTEKPPKEKPPKEKPPKIKPDTCDTDYDAISMVRGEVFIFKGRYFWRRDNNGLMKDYPVELDRFWYGLPSDVTHIDAIYERPGDMKIVIFIGDKYYLFNANYLEPGYPQPLTALGLPRELTKVDATMVWGHNGKTYIFSDTMYWRYDEQEAHVELDYPRDMRMWRGVPYGIDAAFKWSDGNTYFFKGKKYWRFNDNRMKVEKSYPMDSAPFWMGCKKNKVSDGKVGRELNDDHMKSKKSSSITSLPAIYYIALLQMLTFLSFNQL